MMSQNRQAEIDRRRGIRRLRHQLQSRTGNRNAARKSIYLREQEIAQLTAAVDRLTKMLEERRADARVSFRRPRGGAGFKMADDDPLPILQLTPLNPAFRDDPHAIYRRLREAHPVYRDDMAARTSSPATNLRGNAERSHDARGPDKVDPPVCSIAA